MLTDAATAEEGPRKPVAAPEPMEVEKKVEKAAQSLQKARKGEKKAGVGSNEAVADEIASLAEKILPDPAANVVEPEQTIQREVNILSCGIILSTLVSFFSRDLSRNQRFH